MRFFVGGPRVFGFRTGVIFGARDLWNAPSRSGPAAFGQNFVYVIQDAYGVHKIGHSNNPAARLAELQTGSYVPLKLAYVAVCSGRSDNVEDRAHDLLARHRVRGEWFAVPLDVAIAAISGAAAQLGQIARPLDMAAPLFEAPLSEAEAKRGKQNMKIVAVALAAGLLAAAGVVYVMLSTKAAAQSHSEEIKTYANAMAVAVFTSDRCVGIQANTAMLSAMREGMHIQDEDTSAITDIERDAGRSFRAALDKAPDLKTWCDSTYRLFGAEGTVLQGLLQR